MMPGWKLIILVMAMLAMASPALCETDVSTEMDNPEEASSAIDEERMEKEITTPARAPGPAEVDTPGETGVPGKEDHTENSDVPADEPSGEAFWERIDRYHDEAYVFSHRLVEGVNGWFVPRGKEPQEVPASQWRITLNGVAIQEPDRTITGNGKFPLEAHASFSLPDTDRLNIFITTTDPGELPTTALPDRDTSLRVGFAKILHDNFSTSLGVKMRYPPVVVADIAAHTVFESGAWKYYPRQKIYWENEKGEGEVTSFVADRWVTPWDVRVTTALKWSRDKVDSDDRAENDERGWQWDCGLIFGYAWELLMEPDVIRFMGGRDLSRGVAVRLGILGAPWSRHAVSILFLHKDQLRASWLHYFIEPQVQWSWEGDWERTIILACGIEAIFWGGENR